MIMSVFVYLSLNHRQFIDLSYYVHIYLSIYLAQSAGAVEYTDYTSAEG